MHLSHINFLASFRFTFFLLFQLILNGDLPHDKISVCRESLFSLCGVLLCCQWEVGGSASEGALGGGSDLAVSVLSAPHSPSGGVCHFPHRGQHHHSYLVPMLKLSLDLIRTYLDSAWFIHSVGFQMTKNLFVKVSSVSWFDLSPLLTRWRTAVRWPCWRRWPRSRAGRM